MRNAPVLTRPRLDLRRADLYCAAGAVALLATAFLVPLIMSEQARGRLYAGAAPIFGEWLPHAGWGTIPAFVIAVLVVRFGPELARRLPWRRLLLVTWLTAVAWAFALAMVDGWQRGFAGRLITRDEYLAEVGGVADIGEMLHGFCGRILDFQPDSWTTHVSGHPPGALLTFVALDRIGLGGGAWAGLLCLLAGCSAAVAVAVAVRALGAEERARAALPFLVLAPAAIWLAVSADALFAGVTAWAVALLALATRLRRNWVAQALASGLLFGFGLFLSYGMVLMAVPAAAVLVARSLRPAVPALIGVALVVLTFKAAGFWWLDGYHLVVERYYQGIASERPYSYWVWANLAATLCAVGLAAAAALHRVLGGLRFELLREAAWGLRIGALRGAARDTPMGPQSRAAHDTPVGAQLGATHDTTVSAQSGAARDRPIGAQLRAVHDRPVSAQAGTAQDATVGARLGAARDAVVGARLGAARDAVVGAGSLAIHGGRGWRTWFVRSGFRGWSGLAEWRGAVDPAAVVAGAGVVALLLADLSGLSKAETERIWLPFAVWVLAGTGLLPGRAVRGWLMVQAGGALLLVHFILTNW
ncbi:hypothetical protein [Nocardia crassostreae]|uniref:hypothetical protein n=1 Tax=Nocardia crassostreae TaxID=53428 RepID=UPI000B137231|nr:hypothetical protein [Nocardia crassostreae]